ncbi:MAG: ABC transporter substrate-binding protein [Hyphomicrobiales bacterium]|nr:ABC transporter substrate-binding protein [Hyphomicrobiales bacterium]
MILSLARATLAALALAALAAPAGAQTPTVKFTLDFAIQGQQSPFVLAAEGGYFARAGVNVQVDRGYGSADAITKVASGAYDMAFADIGALIQFNGKQAGAKVISVFQVYDAAPMLVLSLKKSGIAKPADLAGKRVASPPGASSRVMFPLFAAANGLDPASIKWIDVTPQLRETLLVQGQTDATTALVTDLAGLERLGISENDLNIMRFSDYGVALYGHVVLTTPEFAAKSPDTVKRVVKGVAEALKAAIADPARSIAAIKKREPLVDEKVERGRLDLVIKNAIVTDHVKREGLSAVEDGRLKQTIDMVAKTFNLPPVDAASVYRPELLPPRTELRLP